ncbi:uncharacterized protein METZ01_LOCUS273153, partial [marine metagenome]
VVGEAPPHLGDGSLGLVKVGAYEDIQ